MRSTSVKVARVRRPITSRHWTNLLLPIAIGLLWAFIAVDATFLLEIDWLTAPHGAAALIAYVIQAVLFWPSAIFTLATRALPLIGWQPGWFGLSLLTAVCGGIPGAFVGLIAFSWSRR